MNICAPFNHLSNNYLLEIQSLDQKYFPNPWPQKSWKDKNSSYYIYGLNVIKGQITTFSVYQVSIDGKFAHLLKILTVPTYRNLGYGQLLLKSDIKYLNDLKVDSILLEVSSNNLNAENFYKKQGFIFVNRIKSFYDNGDDALVMEKVLN